MGFGHRVYKNYDPRAALVKATADEVLADLGANDELLDLAKQLEEVALSDDYFISRKLYPNVDFYTGLIYKAMGFPTRMFTVLFALGRLPGWIAQWREMINDPATKIGRPRQVYTGYTERDYLAARRSAEPLSRRRRLLGDPWPPSGSRGIGGRWDDAATLLWFRRDLRLADHPALLAAAADDADVLGVFVADDAAARTCRVHRGGRSWPAAWRPCRSRWTAGCWSCTAGRRRSSRGWPRRSARRPCTRRRTTGRTAGAATSGSRRHCADAGIDWVATGSPYAVAPGRVRKPDGTGYAVFTPYFRAWTDARLARGRPVRRRRQLDRPAATSRPSKRHDPAELGRQIPAGHEAARARRGGRAAPLAGLPGPTPSTSTTTTGTGPITPAPAGCRRT